MRPDPGEEAADRIDGHAGRRLEEAVSQRVVLRVLGLDLVAPAQAGARRLLWRRGRDDRRRLQADIHAERLEDDVSPLILETKDHVLRSHLRVHRLPPDNSRLLVHDHAVGLDGEIELQNVAVGVAHGDPVAVALAGRGRGWRGAGDPRRAGLGGELPDTEIEAARHLPRVNRGGECAARRAGLLPTGLTHESDGIGSRRQVGEEVMPQGVGLAKRLVRVKLAVVIQVQVDGPVRQAWLDRDGLHLPDDRAGDARRDVFQGEVGLLARLQAVA